MSKTPLILGGVVFLAIAAYFVYPMFLSDEDLVEAMVFEVVDHFNARRPKSMMEAFTADYRDETTGYKKDRIEQGLKVGFLKLRDVRGSFPYRAVLEERLIAVTLDYPERTTGTVKFAVQLLKGPKDNRTLAWETQIEAGVTKTPDGWRISSTAHQTTAGQRPF